MIVTIHLVGNQTITITSNTRKTFERFLEEIFKGKVYCSLTKKPSKNMAINTVNILYIVQEDKE